MADDPLMVDRFEPRMDPRPGDAPWGAMTWPPAPGTTLVGEHVTLTLLDPATDAAPLFTALDQDDVWRHVPGRPGNPDECAASLHTRLADPTCAPWVVRAGDHVVGRTFYVDAVPGDARLEIGFTAYTPRVWGTEVNPETKLLLLDHAFDVLGAGRVQLKTDVRNVRSQQAIARLGARYEGVLRRYQRRADGSVRDTVLFSITVEDWPDVRGALLRRLGRAPA